MRTKEEIIREMYYSEPKLKHGPNQDGSPGPCESNCRKCELEEELKKLPEG